MRRTAVSLVGAVSCMLGCAPAPQSQPSVPPPRQTGTAVPGVGMLRLGDTAAFGSAHFPRSSYVILSPFNARLARGIHARNRPTKVLAYKSSMDLKANDYCARNVAGCDTGVTYAEAVAHDAGAADDRWALRDVDGAAMTGRGYPDNYLADVGSASFQNRWLRNVTTFLAARQLDGVFIDNVLGDVSGWTGGRFPAKYPTDASWEEAMAAFVERVGGALRRRGFFVAVNAYEPYPNTPRFWRRLAPSTDALMVEHWQQNPNDIHELYTSDAPSWTALWDYWETLVDVAQDGGSAFFGLQYGRANDVRIMRYGRASFLLRWNGGEGAYFFNATATADPWHDAWTKDIGRPAGPRYRVGVGWRRNFTAGTVLVNPSSRREQRFELDGTYRTPTGTRPRSVTLEPASAIILGRASRKR